MIHEVTRPEISPEFSIDDIHKIRLWHYEMLKDATVQEKLNFYNRGTSTTQNRIAMHTAEKRNAD